MGKRLKARRRHDEMDVMHSYIPLDEQDNADPADIDGELKKTLEKSQKIGEERMTQV